MSEPIKVGDLVVVVRGALCCGKYRTLGTIFRVDNLYSGRFGKCSACGVVSEGVMARAAGEYDGWEIERLKRIPPLSELEGEKRDEKLTEPA